MFTGIVEEVGSIRVVDQPQHTTPQDGAGGRRVVIQADLVLETLGVGASIAIDGVCLTVVEMGDKNFAVDIVPETLDRTTLGRMAVGDQVNLERAMLSSGRFDGHIVQGHVDSTGIIQDLVVEGIGRRVTIAAPQELLELVVEKGSVAVDGVSLTVAGLSHDSFDIALIPHTIEVTTFGSRNVGDEVNLEVDILAKYVQRLLAR